MNYKKLKTKIDQAIERHPGDFEPYNDLFGLCREYEGEDFQTAHDWNHDLRLAVTLALRSVVERGDFKTADLLNDLLFRSLLFGAPHFFDDYLQAVEFGKPFDKKFYQPRRHYLKRYVDAYGDFCIRKRLRKTLPYQQQGEHEVSFPQWERICPAERMEVGVMQKVSTAYKQSMKQALRERAYIMISFGMVNQELQAKANVSRGAFSYYSNISNLFGEKKDDTIYATLEENFTRVDGSMFFLPRQNASGTYYDTGLVSDRILTEAACEVIINFNTVPTDFKGLTINFGENYPVDFDIISDTGQTVEFRGNEQAEFTTEEVFANTIRLTIRFYQMKNPASRLRIYSIRFGYGLVYYNDSVMNSTLESYVSPIGADIPQIDFSVTLKNYDKYFNVDNPNSAINYLETGQEMDIFYGYQLPDSEEIEWIRGNHLWCSEWESDDYTATIRCQDVFRNMDSEYYKGMYIPAGKSYFDLAVEILRDAGYTQYYIDPRLKELYTKNPMPKVKHKEALQIIANACRCVLAQSRTGIIQIKSNFNPLANIASNGEADYSNTIFSWRIIPMIVRHWRKSFP